MPKFFCEEKDDDCFYLTGEDAGHITRVLRMKPGDTIYAACPDGFDYTGEILSCDSGRVAARILSKAPNESEPSVSVTLYQALPKGDKLDWIVQKTVELGVTRIVPVLTKRCVSRPDARSVEKKIARWQKIAREAAKQSGRGQIPRVEPLLDFPQAVEALSGHELPLLCYEAGGRRLNELVPETARDIGLFIGSEGGFEEEEASRAEAAGIQLATLGKRILRCETAPIAAMAILMNLTKNI